MCFISVFQKKVLSLLVDIRHRLKETQPASSAVYIERIDTMEDFEIQEQRLSDAQAFGILVGFTSLEVMDSLESNNTVHLHTVRFLWGVSVNFNVDLFQQVLQISRIGGRNTKDCVHKVLDRYLQHFLHVIICLLSKSVRKGKLNEIHNQMHCETDQLFLRK